MKKVVLINNANIGENEMMIESDKTLIESVVNFTKQNSLDFIFEYTKSFDEVSSFLNNTEVVAVFTNCPPDGTFLGKSEWSISEGFLSVKADGYEKSKAFLNQLASKYSSTNFYIITGAPDTVISNNEILDLSPYENLFLKRKRELVNHHKGYQFAWFEYVITHLLKSTGQESSNEANWKTRQSFLAKNVQFGAIRVLLVCKDKRLSYQISTQCEKAFDKSVPLFNFFLADDIENAHEILINQSVEIILSITDFSYWSPLLNEADYMMLPFGRVAIVSPSENIRPTSKIDYLVIKDDVISIDNLVQQLFDTVAKNRNNIFEQNTLISIQKNFIKYLEKYSEERAYRWLTVNHYDFIKALPPNEKEFRLFVPVGSVTEMKSIIKKSIFSADRIIFTFAPLSIASVESFTEVSLLNLWNFSSGSFATVIEKNLFPIILEYKEFFQSGKMLFYPTPYLININAYNVQHLMPESTSILKQRPSLPIWKENKVHQYYTSANNFDANHLIIDKYKNLSTIGSALATVDLPYIDNIDPKTLHLLSEDYSISLNKFREQMRNVLEDISSSNDDLNREMTKNRFVREIKSNVQELNSELKSIKKSNAIQQSGAVLLTAAAAITTLSSSSLSNTITELVGGSGIGGMTAQFINYLLQLKDKKQSKYYIFWKMSTENRA